MRIRGKYCQKVLRLVGIFLVHWNLMPKVRIWIIKHLE